jgi:uncharacterized membrane protein YczE
LIRTDSSFQKRVSIRLAALNSLNISVGAALLAIPGKVSRGIAEQHIAWGAINCVIAAIGYLGTVRGEQAADSRDGVKSAAENRAQLRKILWINTGLDVLYMLGGAALALRSRKPVKPRRLGTGIGIVIQGALLFAFDLFHATR